jgi:hypothetical protein
MHDGWELFTPTLLVEVEENLLIRCVALHTLARVWRRGKIGKHMHALAHLASLGRAWRGEARQGKARRWARVHNVCMNSLPKSGSKPHRSTTSFCRLFFATSPCLIRFDRDRPNRLWDAVTLGRSSL